MLCLLSWWFFLTNFVLLILSFCFSAAVFFVFCLLLLQCFSVAAGVVLYSFAVFQSTVRCLSGCSLGCLCECNNNLMWLIWLILFCCVFDRNYNLVVCCCVFCLNVCSYCKNYNLNVVAVVYWMNLMLLVNLTSMLLRFLP